MAFVASEKALSELISAELWASVQALRCPLYPLYKYKQKVVLNYGTRCALSDPCSFHRTFWITIRNTFSQNSTSLIRCKRHAFLITSYVKACLNNERSFSISVSQGWGLCQTYNIREHKFKGSQGLSTWPSTQIPTRAVNHHGTKYKWQRFWRQGE